MTHVFPREGASSSSTSRSSQRSETDDDRMIAMALSEEYAKLDGVMAKHLTNLTSIPHVPQINTYFPTYSDATMDHYHLLDRLNAYGLFELKECNSLYEGYVPMKYKHYCKKMKYGEWGDHVTLQAPARKKMSNFFMYFWQFAAKICLLTSFRDTCFFEILPQYQAPRREIWLSFWSEVHYNSLYDARDLPSKYKPRKKHWLLF
ncbi:hypothetical protein Zm00014a_010342 [Zea mays]|uniref:OTU domain-containing protein n=1 Tax=Zea mays TaxID=4577 RepID=A0A317Y1H6_MAIZE|nr:hypothetical protein Zm00014a_010342 [Zea mays]